MGGWIFPCLKEEIQDGPLAFESCSGKGTVVSSAFRVKGLNALTRRGRRMHLSYATEKYCAGRGQSYIRALAKYPKEWTSEKMAAKKGLQPSRGSGGV